MATTASTVSTTASAKKPEVETSSGVLKNNLREILFRKPA